MAPKTEQYQSTLCNDVTVTIADGETESSAASLKGTSLVGIDIPAGFEGTSLTFQVSSDGITYNTYYRLLDAAPVTAVVVTGTAGSYSSGNFDFTGYNFIKLVSATQTGDITITLKTRPIN